MARISGIDLPNSKRVEIGLTYIYGIGKKISNDILIKAKIDKNLRVNDLTDEQVNKIRTIIEKVCELTGSGKPQYGKVSYRPGENMVLYANISKEKKILQWEPEISLEEGLQKSIDWFAKDHS